MRSTGRYRRQSTIPLAGCTVEGLTVFRAVIFMNNILKDPERVFDYARLYTVSVAGSLIWGHRATSLDSFWYKDFYELMDLVSL